ncbi:FkbM family methyltransferase [Sphingomonas bacterium]|uniref:FkbM family methyltransferase n=1 Tax=Sphingomonas bacterium TaxID=1895847 RepID=UPI001576873F|nr:FkbM family methyltransferase [Sphingomonas bacterium]
MFRGRRLRYSDAEGFAHSLVEIYRQQVYLFDDRTGSPHIIDAGANIGLSVLYFKDRFPRASVVAYEPDEEIFDMLADNVGQLPDVTLHRAAAWIADTELTFYRERSLAGSVAADFDGRGDKVKVPAVRLRDEITKRRVTFLKIDIEGAENEVLFDIADVLDNVERLFFEYHSVAGDRQRLGQLLNLVTERGFRFVINGTHGPGLPFVESARFGFDLQCNVFCYRNLPN